MKMNFRSNISRILWINFSGTYNIDKDRKYKNYTSIPYQQHTHLVKTYSRLQKKEEFDM